MKNLERNVGKYLKNLKFKERNVKQLPVEK